MILLRSSHLSNRMPVQALKYVESQYGTQKHPIHGFSTVIPCSGTRTGPSARYIGFVGTLRTNLLAVLAV